MSSLRLLAAAPVGAMALALALAAAAQTPPPPGAAPAPGDRAAHRVAMRDHRGEHRARMIADWTQVLRLTPAQAQALQAAMAPPARREAPPRGEHDRRAMDGETTLQRLDRKQARMEEREGRLRAHLAAMRAFYTSLSPDQQKSFDALTRLTHGGMRGRHGMRGRGWGPGGRGGPGGEGGPAPRPRWKGPLASFRPPTTSEPPMPPSCATPSRPSSSAKTSRSTGTRAP